jgi:hypothetical protein
MKLIDKLHAKWSRAEDDLILHWPGGSQTKCDGGYLAYTLEPILEELERRGYDKTTIRFSIEPQIGNHRFTSQQED